MMNKSALALLLPILVAASACPPEEGPSLEPKLSAIHEELFMPRCNANACHGGPGPAAQLNLEQDPHANLVNVESVADPLVLRVAPGKPDESLLYLVLIDSAHGVRKMPVGGDVEDYEAAAVKQWIEDGAKDN